MTGKNNFMEADIYGEDFSFNNIDSILEEKRDNVNLFGDMEEDDFGWDLYDSYVSRMND